MKGSWFILARLDGIENNFITKELKLTLGNAVVVIQGNFNKLFKIAPIFFFLLQKIIACDKPNKRGKKAIQII